MLVVLKLFCILKLYEKSDNMEIKTAWEDNMHSNESAKSNIKIFTPWELW